jgi:sodium transport system permease protein
LLEEHDRKIQFTSRYLAVLAPETRLTLKRLDVKVPDTPDPKAFRDHLDRGSLEQGKIDVMLAIPPGFQQRLGSDQPEIHIITGDKEATGNLVNLRVNSILSRWKADLKQARLAQLGLPPGFDEPILIRDSLRDRPDGKKDDESLFTLLIRIFPFILVLWSLAGALYPAVDLCAGEKERNAAPWKRCSSAPPAVRKSSGASS